MICGTPLPDGARDQAGVRLNGAVTIRCTLSAFHGVKVSKFHCAWLDGGIRIRWPGVGSMIGEWNENTPKYDEMVARGRERRR